MIANAGAFNAIESGPTCHRYTDNIERKADNLANVLAPSASSVLMFRRLGFSLRPFLFFLCALKGYSDVLRT